MRVKDYYVIACHGTNCTRKRIVTVGYYINFLLSRTTQSFSVLRRKTLKYFFALCWKNFIKYVIIRVFIKATKVLRVRRVYLYDPCSQYTIWFISLFPFWDLHFSSCNNTFKTWTMEASRYLHYSSFSSLTYGIRQRCLMEFTLIFTLPSIQSSVVQVWFM